MSPRCGGQPHSHLCLCHCCVCRGVHHSCFVVVICGSQVWFPRWREMDVTLLPPLHLPLMTTTLPPLGGGRITRGWTGDPRLLNLPPRALGPAWRHRILGILNTIFVVVVSIIVVILLLPSSAAGALSPYSRRASTAVPPQPQPINADLIELPCPVCDDAKSHHQPCHRPPRCTAHRSCCGNRCNRPHPAHGGGGNMLYALSHKARGGGDRA